jgi:acyl carrier protein
VEEGVIEYIGRRDEQVKVRGHRIELGEIEAVLREQSSVLDAVVIAKPDKANDKRLIAYLVMNQQEAGVSDVRTYLEQKLPAYMIPAAIVVMDEFPLTANGKVERRALPAPDRVAAEFIAPRTELEEAIAKIWAEVLGIERVGISDNFFELGGHSLLATRIISSIREQFKVELPLRRLFETPTVAALASAIVEARIARDEFEIPVIQRVERGDKSIDELLVELSQLSEDDLKALLEEDAD